MDDLTEKLAASFPVEMMKQGLLIAEAPLKKMLEKRFATLQKTFTWLYNERLPAVKEPASPEFEKVKKQIERSEAEQDFIKVVAEYTVAADHLLKAQTLENQQLRETIAALEYERTTLKDKLSEKSIDLLLLKNSRKNRFGRLNLAVDRILLKKQIDLQQSENGKGEGK